MWEVPPTSGMVVGHAQGAAGPRRGPKLDTLVYLKTLLELALLLLAIPWILLRIAHNPRKAIKDLGEHHL
jgi:hypothetical protein